MAVQLILKNSNVEDKHPLPSQLANGELALNYNEEGAFLSCKDSAGNLQQVGGVKIADATPGSPSKQALWFQPSTGKLFVYDGTGWLVVASGGSGPGSSTVDQILAGNGINSDPASGLGTITLDADIDTSKGLKFLSGKIALAIGEGLEFDPTTGEVKASASATTYKGEVNLTTNSAKPTGVSAGDTFYNGGTGTSDAVWNPSPATGTSVTAGDLVVYNGTGWDYIPSGAAYPNPALWSRTSGVLSPSTSSDDVEIGGGNIELKANGASKFVKDLGLGNSAPNVKLAINVQSRGEDGIDFTNSGGNNVYSSIRGIASSNEIYFANRTVGKTLSIEKLGHVLIGGTLPSAPAISLNATGTAEFAGLVSANSLEVRTDSVNTPARQSFLNAGSAIGYIGDANAFTTNGPAVGTTLGIRAAQNRNIKFYAGSTITEIASFNSDGSAKFSDNVDFGSLDTSSTSTAGVKVFSGGIIQVQRTSGTFSSIFSAYRGSTETVAIKADGRGLFTGAVSIGGTAAANTIDEYEEASWTCNVVDNSNNSQSKFSASNSKYIRIGNTVTCYLQLSFDTTGTLNTTTFKFTLPFSNGASGSSVFIQSSTLEAESIKGFITGGFMRCSVPSDVTSGSRTYFGSFTYMIS